MKWLIESPEPSSKTKLPVSGILFIFTLPDRVHELVLYITADPFFSSTPAGGRDFSVKGVRTIAKSVVSEG